MHVEVNGTLTAGETLQGTLSESASLTAQMTIPTTAEVPRYDGSYTFTPSSEQQTIVIDHQMAMQDIVIEAIPSNYGRITWNGSTITVS